MQLLYPLMLDGGQPARDVLALLQDPDTPTSTDRVLVRQVDRLRVRWFVATHAQLIATCLRVSPAESLTAAMRTVSERTDDAVEWPEAVRAELSSALRASATAWQVVFAGTRFTGLLPPEGVVHRTTPARASAPASAASVAPPAASSSMPFPVMPPRSMPIPASPTMSAPFPVRRPESEPAAPRGPTRGGTRGHTTTPAAKPTAAGAEPAVAVEPGSAAPTTTDTLLALARVDAPTAIAPSPGASARLTIGLAPAPSPTADGVMRFETPTSDTQFLIDVMVEAPDFTCATGWKHRLAVPKAAPFAAFVALDLRPIAPDDRTVRTATVRVHYSYAGQPAGTALRTITLGDATAAELSAITPPRAATLTIAPSSAPVDITIRVSRRDQNEAARDLIWTMVDCAHPAVVLPDAPLVQKVGDRDNASSFASKVTSQVNAADGTVTVDNMLCSIGTLIRRAMPAAVLTVLAAVRTAVGPSRLTRVLLLTDECHVPWELAYLDAPPDSARAPFLGAQYAISRWIHGEDDIPVPPPATLAVHDLAIVLGSYEGSHLAPLPHAKDETTALTAEAIRSPTRFPRVTSVAATADALVDLLNGALPAASGPLAPELVHFACHGEVLGTGIAKRSVLYLDDGSPLQETLFVSSKLGRTRRSFLFMNACQVGVGGEELGQYAGFAGFAIGAGFSGFIGPLWSVNDEVAKRIAIDFYRRCFGTDGAASRPVADVMADMRSQYLSEPDPKKRQSTWLAYVHYGHPHFTLTHA